MDVIGCLVGFVNGSMVNGSVGFFHLYLYMWLFVEVYNPLILIFDPNFLGHPSDTARSFLFGKKLGGERKKDSSCLSL